ncbi:hypothetical protein Fmac_008145 [Flemingia macrophylla]|uniref:Electron transfer flavoprotein alpha/beta-subunit N-terminal domain-containing protein n=1 Tax=Flemingia macrophylla TaxID=520843 RepID=A0ABD1MYZ3_9FABA
MKLVGSSVVALIFVLFCSLSSIFLVPFVLVALKETRSLLRLFFVPFLGRNPKTQHVSKSHFSNSGVRQISELQFIPGVVGVGLIGVFLLSWLTFAALSVVKQCASKPWSKLVHLVQQSGGYSHIIVAANSFGKDVMPRAVALLDVSPITVVTEISDSNTCVSEKLRNEGQKSQKTQRNDTGPSSERLALASGRLALGRRALGA